jgi:hypothetical protein
MQDHSGYEQAPLDCGLCRKDWAGRWALGQRICHWLSAPGPGVRGGQVEVT